MPPLPEWIDSSGEALLSRKEDTVLVVVAFSQPQLTTKNEIGNPFWGSLSHFFVGAILQQHL